METRLTVSTGATTPPAAEVPLPVTTPPALGGEAVLAGLREGVVVCDRQGVVRAVNPAARALVPGLTEGQVVDACGCPVFARVLHAGPDAPDGEMPDIEVTADGGDVRRVAVHGRELPGGDRCWYLLDVTESYRRADALLGAEERARFLADAGRALHGVLHFDRTLRAVAELAVPRLAPTALAFVHTGGDTVRWARADAGAGAPRAATGSLSVAELRAVPRLREVLTSDVAADGWDAVELAALEVWAEGTAPTHRPLRAMAMPSTAVARSVLVLVDPTHEDPAERELVAAYAERAGAALAAAALFREQSHLGAVLQESLAPPTLPGGTGVVLGAAYRPARETLRVGGDFYEVMPADSGGVTFLLGDVCGKGIEAAVRSGRVRQSLHALRLLERDPVRLLELLNTAMLDAAAAHGEDPRFATMILGTARRHPERADGTVVVDLATGGHPPPMVLRADGRVETVDLEGTLVGAIRGAGFGHVEVVLAPGELCLLYSDGVTEARGPGGFYGEDRLEATLASCRGAPAAVTCERVLQLLAEWLDGRDHDDVALLALQAPGTA